MTRTTWTAPPRWLRFFNKINIGVQKLGLPCAPKVAVFRIEPR